MNKVTYNEDDIKKLVALLDSLTVSGLQNVRALFCATEIINRGVVSKKQDGPLTKQEGKDDIK